MRCNRRLQAGTAQSTDYRVNLSADLRVPGFYEVDTHFVEEMGDRELDVRIEVNSGCLFSFTKG